MASKKSPESVPDGLGGETLGGKDVVDEIVKALEGSGIDLDNFTSEDTMVMFDGLLSGLANSESALTREELDQLSDWIKEQLTREDEQEASTKEGEAKLAPHLEQHRAIALISAWVGTYFSHVRKIAEPGQSGYVMSLDELLETMYDSMVNTPELCPDPKIAFDMAVAIALYSRSNK